MNPVGASIHVSFRGSLREFLSYAEDEALDYVEIKMDRAELVRKLENRSSLDILKDDLSSFELRYTLHAPYIDVNLSSINPEIGKASERVVERTIRVASSIGAETITVHAGRLSRDYSKSLIPFAREKLINRLLNLRALAEEFGVMLSLENDHSSTNWTIASSPDQLVYLIERTGCGFTFDVGHANTVTDPSSFLNVLGDRIVLVHLHDNDGTKDSHLAIGDGKINFRLLLSRMKRIRYQGNFSCLQL